VIIALSVVKKYAETLPTGLSVSLLSMGEEMSLTHSFEVNP